jgi:hypothetical protein
MNKKEAVDNLRSKTLERITNFFSAGGEDVQQTKTGTIMFPAVDELGAECFVTITVQIPKGSRDGEAYDGYAEAENYRMETKAKQEEKLAKEKQKQKKISRDEQRRADAKAGQEAVRLMIERYEANTEPNLLSKRKSNVTKK